MKKTGVILLCLVIALFPGASRSEITVIGDVNGDGIVSLPDAIMALQFQSGIKPSGRVQLTADVSKDGRVGLAEAVYGLQIVAGLRLPPIFAWVYKGELRQGGVDATTFVLPDGTYRQLYGNTVTAGQQDVATSKDGLVWTTEGSAGLPANVGGRVVRLHDGRYRIYTGVNYLKGFTSVDGKTWQEEPASSFTAPDPSTDPSSGPQNNYGAGDVAIMSDGSYRMFYEHSETGPRFRLTSIASATSTGGLVWQKDLAWNSDYFYPTGATPDHPETAGPGPAHPSVITLPDGTYKLFYWNDMDIWSATSRDGQTWTNRKLENIFGADPDGLVLPDGRIVLFVNWRDGSLPASNPAQHRMWMYVRQQVPFSFAPPAAPTQMSRQNPSQTLSITGTPGKDIRFTATVYSGMKGVFAADDPASPMKVRLTPASDGTAVQLSLTDISVTWVEGLRGGIIVVADDGTTRVSAAVPFNISPQ